MYDLNTPMWKLTVGEFLEVYGRVNQTQQINLAKQNEADTKSSENRFVHGLKGISELFNCSISTAIKIKKSGVIDKAITQIGRKIVVDSDLALNLVRKSKVKYM